MERLHSDRDASKLLGVREKSNRLSVPDEPRLQTTCQLNVAVHITIGKTCKKKTENKKTNYQVSPVQIKEFLEIKSLFCQANNLGAGLLQREH